MVKCQRTSFTQIQPGYCLVASQTLVKLVGLGWIWDSARPNQPFIPTTQPHLERSVMVSAWDPGVVVRVVGWPIGRLAVEEAAAAKIQSTTGLF